jgi:hypothetical protein
MTPFGRLLLAASLAREYASRALEADLPADEIRDLKEVRWHEILTRSLANAGKTTEDIHRDEIGAAWKIPVAARLRLEGAVPYRWIATALNLGPTGTLRSALCRRAKPQHADPFLPAPRSSRQTATCNRLTPSG